MQASFSKYFFSTLVGIYLLTSVGLPVYLHYCGGEVEEVSYLVESNGCCGEEVPDNDCCRNEGIVLQNTVDFTLKSFNADLVKTVTDLFFLPKVFTFVQTSTVLLAVDQKLSPPPWQHGLLPDITVLRI